MRKDFRVVAGEGAGLVGIAPFGALDERGQRLRYADKWEEAGPVSVPSSSYGNCKQTGEGLTKEGQGPGQEQSGNLAPRVVGLNQGW